jgi:beta-glucosidase/6-phospho-beta-glucosidase/beta-galactosidase
MAPVAFVESDTFRSFFIGGFECSSHRRTDRRRLDLIVATGHDRLADSDYRQLRALGLRTFRDGLRWHLIEALPGYYSWNSFLNLLRAAQAADVQVIWDLFHYGWPDGLDIFAPAFIDRFARFAAAAARVVREESDAVPFYCPVNEISYFAWAAGEKRMMNPFCDDQADRLKKQLVRASIAAIEAVRSVEPRARFVHTDPVIHVAPASPRDMAAAEAFRISQYQAMDMMTGRLEPGLGGRTEYLDLLGLIY